MASKKQSNSRYRRLILSTLVIVGIVILTLGYLFRQKPISSNQTPVPTQATPFDFTSQKFTVEGETISSTHVINRTVSTSGLLAAAVVVDDSQGSGTFYYLIGANRRNGEYYSVPVLLGDRIQIVSLEVSDPEAHDNGMITVTFLDRQATAPLSAAPTLHKTQKYSFEDTGNLISVLH